MNLESKLLMRKIFAHTFLVLFILMIMAPFLTVIASSFSRGHFAPSKLFPSDVSLNHWKFVLGIPHEEVVNVTTGETRMIKPEVVPVQWFWNSIKISMIASLGILLLSGTCAYAFARMKFAFKEQTMTGLLILQMFPMVLALVAFYTILEFIGQFAPGMGLNTHAGLTLVYLGGVSIYIWMIKGYFETISTSIEESARIDGASPFQAFILILLPMSAPIFAVVFILSFISYMSEYPVASVVLQTGEKWTLAVGANSFLYEQQKLWGRFSALAVLSGIPITILFIVCQRFLVSGLTAGGVKE